MKRFLESDLCKCLQSTFSISEKERDFFDLFFQHESLIYQVSNIKWVEEDYSYMKNDFSGFDYIGYVFDVAKQEKLILRSWVWINRTFIISPSKCFDIVRSAWR
jgi:hypothetical protein